MYPSTTTEVRTRIILSSSLYLWNLDCFLLCSEIVDSRLWNSSALCRFATDCFFVFVNGNMKPSLYPPKIHSYLSLCAFPPMPWISHKKNLYACMRESDYIDHQHSLASDFASSCSDDPRRDRQQHTSTYSPEKSSTPPPPPHGHPSLCSFFFFLHISTFQLLDKPRSQVSSLFPPRFLPSIFIVHMVQQSHFSSIFRRVDNSRSRAFRKSSCAQEEVPAILYE